MMILYLQLWNFLSADIPPNSTTVTKVESKLTNGEMTSKSIINLHNDDVVDQASIMGIK